MTNMTERRALGTVPDPEYRKMLFQWLNHAHQDKVRQVGEEAFYAADTVDRTEAQMRVLQQELAAQVRRNTSAQARDAAVRVLKLIPLELTEISRRRGDRVPGGGAARLEGLSDAEFTRAVRSWLTAEYETYLTSTAAFRDPRNADRALRAVTALQRGEDDDPRPLPQSRVDRELAALVEVALWGRPLSGKARPKPVGAPGADGAELTPEDREEIEYFAGADDPEFTEGVNEWLTLGDDDGSGERVFLSPRLVRRTHDVIGQLIHRATLAISEAQYGGQASDETHRLLEVMTQARADTREAAGIRRKSREVVKPPKPTPREQLEIDYLADVADDEEFHGAVSDWMATDTPDPSSRTVFLSRPLAERTLQALTVLYGESTERLTSARRRGNRDRIRDIQQRRHRIYLMRAQASGLVKIYRKGRQNRGAASPRQATHELLVELFPDEFAQIKRQVRKRKPAIRELATRHHKLAAAARRRLRGGDSVEQVAAWARQQTA